MIFQDSGEVLSTCVGWAVAWTGHAITFQLFANIVIQTMIVKKPDFLESGIFENNIKWVVTVVIPLLTIIMYILAYFKGGLEIPLKIVYHRNIGKFVLINKC